jgi:hypothetical protein
MNKMNDPSDASIRRVIDFAAEGLVDRETLVELDLAGSAGVRRYANTFCVTDDRGRLLVLSAEDFRLIREARL